MNKKIATIKQKPAAVKFLILILGILIAIGPLTIDAYLPAFSAIAKSYQIGNERVQFSLTAYLIGISVGQILYGPIIDRYGKKPPLIFGLALYVLGSIACYKTFDINNFIALRFLQAIGGCSTIVVMRAIVRDIFSPQESARVFSQLMLVMGIAPIIAPTLGSFILEFFGWREIFLFLTIYGILCLLLSYFFIPETKGFNSEEKISDAFKKYYQIARDKNFINNALCGGIMMSGLMTYLTASPFLYLEYFHLSPKNFSLVFAINSIGFICASQLNYYFLKKFSIEKVLKKSLKMALILGLLIVCAGLFCRNFWAITILIFFTLALCGAINPNTVALSLANQAKHSGSASALYGTIQFALATICSLLVSESHNDSAIPICLMIGFCSICSFMIFKFKPVISQI